MRLIAAFLLLCAQAWGTIALVNTASGSDYSGASGTTIVASAIPVTTGNFIAVFYRAANSSAFTATASDTAGNTYSVVTYATNTSDKCGMLYAKNITGNAANIVTLTLSGAVPFRAVMVLQYSGIDPVSPLDTFAIGNGSASTPTVGPFTTSTANELIVAGVMTNSGLSFVAGSGYTLQITAPSSQGAVEDRIVSSIQTGVTATFSNTATWGMVAATFKAQARGGSQTFIF